MKNILELDIEKQRFPVFPLPVFMLPGGKARLRVFEAKYLKMLSLVSSHQHFIIQSINTWSKENESWGSLVKIQDFNQGDDGILEIDVECSSLVNLYSPTNDNNDLTFAWTKPFHHWSQSKVDGSLPTSVLSTALNDAIASSPILKNLYQHKALENNYWVIARWLELLPLKNSLKVFFIKESSFDSAKSFVKSIVCN